MKDILNCLWLVGFKPRFPQPQCRVLTTKLQPQHFDDNKHRYFNKFYPWQCSRQGLEATTQNYNKENEHSRIPKVNNFKIIYKEFKILTHGMSQGHKLCCPCYVSTNFMAIQNFY